ncbi:MAG: hypothetical protein ACJ0K4_15000, partial [Verrucomicrobiales bacterium]
YILTKIKKEGGQKLIDQASSILPKPLREKNRLGLYLAFNIKDSAKSDLLEQSHWTTAIQLLSKLGLHENKLTFINSRINLLAESKTDSNNELIKLLEAKVTAMSTLGYPKEEITKATKKLSAAPPRNKNLSEKLIDLSAYYNASIFHYTGWHSNSEKFDMRFLPEKYNAEQWKIPFDLRGIIQLNSGKFNDGLTANEGNHFTRYNRVYPDAVKEINIKAKTQRIHFLIGLLFGGWPAAGEKAATLVVHFDDNSKEIIPLMAKQDIFDWWWADEVEKLDPDKIGWIGENNLGQRRCLNKYSWENPYPDKTVSHVDFESGLIRTAPFLVAITVE